MLLDKRIEFEPMEYKAAYDYWLAHQESYWNHTKISLRDDVVDFKDKMTDKQRNVIGNTLKSFTQTELVVGSEYWSSKPAVWFPKPEITMMCLEFAAREMIHVVAYSQVDTNLGVKDYSGFMQEPSVKNKLDALSNMKGDSLKEKALSLAIFSAFAEGVNLFSSFAILLNFSRFEMMKGLGALINYSILDECFTEGTEVLTNKGWKDFKDLKENDLVAQFNQQNQEITFVKPERIINKPVSGDVYKFSSEGSNLNLSVTSGHDMLYRFDYEDGKSYRKQKAVDFKVNQPKKFIPKAGYKVGGRDQMSLVEKFLVMAQADGSISNRYTGSRCGTIPVNFSFSKERKIQRFFEIVESLGWEIKERKPDHRRNFSVNMPIDMVNPSDVKSLSWVDLSEVSQKWCKSFIEEVSLWDGYIYENNTIYYSSIIESNVNMVQSVATVCGMATSKGIQVDDRSENYSDVHRLHIYPHKDEVRCGRINKEKIDYSGNVYCVTVPQGSIVVRNQGVVAVTGNCEHSEAGCWLFRTLVDEYDLWDQDLKKNIYEAARLSVKLEDDFLDKVFEMGDIPGLTKHEIKSFIRVRANQKLNELGLKSNWKNVDMPAFESVDTWFSLGSSGEKDNDTFVKRGTGIYAKGNKDWTSMWNDVDYNNILTFSGKALND